MCLCCVCVFVWWEVEGGLDKTKEVQQTCIATHSNRTPKRVPFLHRIALRLYGGRIFSVSECTSFLCNVVLFVDRIATLDTT